MVLVRQKGLRQLSNWEELPSGGEKCGDVWVGKSSGHRQSGIRTVMVVP